MTTLVGSAHYFTAAVYLADRWARNSGKRHAVRKDPGAYEPWLIYR